MKLLQQTRIASRLLIDNYSIDIINSLPAAVYLCDNDGYIQFYNDAAVDLWGREPEIGKELWCGSWKIFTPFGEHLPLDSCPMAITLKEKRPVVGEEILVERPDGQRRNILPHPRPVYDGNGQMIGAINMLVDISDNIRMKQVNQNLQSLNEQLEQFAFSASHDLQEPLRKIKTYASLLNLKQANQLDSEGKTYLHKIHESTERMSGLIHDLLTYTTYSSESAKKEPVDLKQVVLDVLEELELQIEEKEAKIEMGDLPLLIGDISCFSRLFYNLISNSIKFSKESIQPRIKISYSRHPNHLEFLVADNGIGFDMRYREQIFKVFTTLENKNNYSGNGIGLSICRKIVENYKGEISATSLPHKYTTFTFRLPVSMLAQ